MSKLLARTQIENKFQKLKENFFSIDSHEPTQNFINLINWIEYFWIANLQYPRLETYTILIQKLTLELSSLILHHFPQKNNIAIPSVFEVIQFLMTKDEEDLIYCHKQSLKYLHARLYYLAPERIENNFEEWLRQATKRHKHYFNYIFNDFFNICYSNYAPPKNADHLTSSFLDLLSQVSIPSGLKLLTGLFFIVPMVSANYHNLNDRHRGMRSICEAKDVDWQVTNKPPIQIDLDWRYRDMLSAIIPSSCNSELLVEQCKTEREQLENFYFKGGNTFKELDAIVQNTRSKFSKNIEKKMKAIDVDKNKLNTKLSEKQRTQFDSVVKQGLLWQKVTFAKHFLENKVGRCYESAMVASWRLLRTTDTSIKTIQVIDIDDIMGGAGHTFLLINSNIPDLTGNAKMSLILEKAEGYICDLWNKVFLPVSQRDHFYLYNINATYSISVKTVPFPFPVKLYSQMSGLPEQAKDIIRREFITDKLTLDNSRQGYSFNDKLNFFQRITNGNDYKKQQESLQCKI